MTRRRSAPLLALIAALLAGCGARSDLGERSDGADDNLPDFAQLAVAEPSPTGARLITYSTIDGPDFDEVEPGPFNSPCSPIFDEAGRLVFLEASNQGRIVRVDLASGSIEPSDTGFGWLGDGHQDLALDGRGGFYLTSNDAIVQVDSIGGERVLHGNESLFGRPTGVGVAPGGKIVVVDGYNGRIVQIDDITGIGITSWEVVPGTVPTGEDLFFDVAFDSAGRIHFADALGQVHRIDDISGRGHVTFPATAGDGTPMIVRGVSVGPDDRIYLSLERQNEVELWSIADMDGSGLVKLAKPPAGMPGSLCGGPAIR